MRWSHDGSPAGLLVRVEGLGSIVGLDETRPDRTFRTARLTALYNGVERTEPRVSGGSVTRRSTFSRRSPSRARGITATESRSRLLLPRSFRSSGRRARFRSRPRPLVGVEIVTELESQADPRLGSLDAPAGEHTRSIEPLLITVAETAGVLGVGRTTVYELIASGDLEVVHIGRSARVPVAATRAFVDRLRARAAS